MGSLGRVFSRIQLKYVTLEYCFILMSLCWMFSGFEFLILCLLPSKLILFYLHQNEYLIYYLKTNHKAWSNFYLVSFQFREYLFV